MIILNLTVCLTSTVTVRVKSLCDEVSIFTLQQEKISQEITSSLFLCSTNYLKALP